MSSSRVLSDSIQAGFLARGGRAGFVAAVLCCAPAAHGADEPVILSWSAPADGSCPDQAYALGEIHRHVGSPPTDRAPIRASVVIRTRGGSYEVVLQTEQGDVVGERIFRDASCGAVADAAIVVLAWMIDPTAMSRESRDAPAAAPAPAPAPEPPRDVRVAPPPRRRAHVWRASLGSSGDVGTLPAAAVGAEARIEAAMLPLRLAAYGSYWPSSSTTATVLSDGRSAGGTFSLGAVGVQVCYDAPLADGPEGPDLSLCTGPELDVMKGRGFGVSNPAEGTKAWVAATIETRASVPIGGPLRLSLAVAGVLPARREHFSLQGVGDVHQPAAVAGRAGLDLELVF
jgi:hypothetical protein